MSLNHMIIVTSEFATEKNFDGGLANYTYKLAKLMMSQNFSVKVIVVVNYSPKENELLYEDIQVVRVQRFKYIPKLLSRIDKLHLRHLINQKNRMLLGYYETGFIVNKEIKKRNKLRKVDIVHFPHLRALSLFFTKKIPHIIRISSSTLDCQISGGYNSSYKEVLYQHQIEVKAMKKANGVFGPSIQIAKKLEKEIGKKINIIETPIKEITSVDESLLRKHLSSSKYILFFGSISTIKGVDTIANMLYEFLNKNEDINFVFVGKKIQNKVEGMNLWDYLIFKSKEYSDRINHFDSMNHDQLYPIIQKSEYVVLPSRIDNFPNTCIEAMSQGKIVVGTNGNGFEQLIENNKNGFLIDVNDDRALLKICNYILSLDQNTKKQLELKSLLTVDRLKPEIIGKQLLNYYSQFI